MKIKGPQACPKHHLHNFLEPLRSLHVLISNRAKGFRLSHLKTTMCRLAEMVVCEEGRNYDEVSISFVGQKEMCRLHELYFDDPSPTDCISFPLDNGEESEYTVLGEVVIMPATAARWSKSHGTDFWRELALYIIHGLLHLLGYDDRDRRTRSQMRAKEKKYLRLATKKGCMLHG